MGHEMKSLDVNNYYTLSEHKENCVAALKTTFIQQSEALNLVANHFDENEYLKAIEIIMACKGHVIVCGMGKSGHVGKKIAATLASTGTPSFFLHPAEAFHGDLGMITRDDVVVLISNSGETDEVLQLIPSLKAFGNKVIALTGNEHSTMGKNADAILKIMINKEACPNNLAPTTSTTVTIAIGDALAVALMKRRQFQPNDFAKYHPGGALGRRLLTRVKDVMTTQHLPLVTPETSMTEVLVIMNQSRLGVAIVHQNSQLVGIITDGDLRRTFAKSTDMSQIQAGEVMTLNPKVTYESSMLSDAEAIMHLHKVSSLIVLNDGDEICGIIQIFNI
ncbi:KpsF/GutQ family sugar-phosphate isomerase [Vibrio cholerae]|nr:KpsF/GutQ family sugar-phosphate isomerase [Vibrio cholerae]EGR0808048.1 KpsF/GutQ family sugar-phosphate isomerase [Vibrio cholerae]EGR0811699.1 KpsF/GutQ family sugar-phosphate isomerase [Vibrio cholerae]EGR0874675.1 KpsF/GutQ family sugar-phosphate isomerase [Vibrio cholerae]EGR2127467.1 KpsF/GutQ family sugar-phosphate isomerase [Vibrio cholerae]